MMYIPEFSVYFDACSNSAYILGCSLAPPTLLLHSSSIYIFTMHLFTSPYTSSLHHALLHFTMHFFTSPYTSSLHHTLLHFTIYLFTSPCTSSLHHTLLHFTIHLFTSPYTSSLHHALLHFTMHFFTSPCTSSLHHAPLHFTIHLCILPYTSFSIPYSKGGGALRLCFCALFGCLDNGSDNELNNILSDVYSNLVPFEFVHSQPSKATNRPSFKILMREFNCHKHL